MKITLTDVNQVMSGLRCPGKTKEDVPKELADQVIALNELITEAKDWGELCQQICITATLHCIKEGKSDFDVILKAAVQMAAMAGATIGFRLGLREAGLEMGIPSAEESKP